jgi:hypothetical protein
MPETTAETTPTNAVAVLHERDESIEHILESAVVANWTDVVRGGRSGLIHIEYSFAPNDTLDRLQVWASRKPGYWLLVCSYRMSPSQSHESGIYFDNGYQSEGLAHIFDVVMQHQNLFALPHNLGRQGLLQISTPTENQCAGAAALMNDTFDRLNSLAPPKGKTVAPAGFHSLPLIA